MESIETSLKSNNASMALHIIHPESSSFRDLERMPGFSVEGHTIEDKIERRYLLSGLMITEGGNVIGRVAVYKNPYHTIEGDEVISLGYFECINNQRVAGLLFDRAKLIANLYKCNRMMGPIDGSTWRSYRYQTKGPTDGFFTEYTVPDYYYDLWYDAGFSHLASYRSDIIDLNEKIRKVDDVAYQNRTGISIDNLAGKNLKKEITRIGELCLEAFSDNYLYSPINICEFEDMYYPLIKYIDPKMILIAERDNELVGFLFAIPNYKDTNKNGVVIKTLARNPGNAFGGLGSVLTSQLIHNAVDSDMDYVISAYFLKSGMSENISERYGGSIYKEYQLLQYQIRQ